MTQIIEQNPTSTLEAIWGVRLLDEGFLGMPNLVVRNYRQLGIEHGEFGLICTILTYKHDNRDPYPSHETLAEHLQCSTRQVRKWIDNLEAKQLLRVGRRRNKENKQLGPMVYNFHPLIDAALQLVGEKPLPETAEQWDIEYQKPLESEVPLAQNAHKKPLEPQVPVANLLEPEVPNLGPEVPVNRLINRLKDDAYSAHAHVKENISNFLQNRKPALGEFQGTQDTFQAPAVSDTNYSTHGSLAISLSSIVEIPSDTSDEPIPAYQAIETVATSLLQRPMLNALELNMIDDLLESGVAVETILQGMQESFDLYQPKFSRDRIRSLLYCEPRIWELHEHQQHVPQKIEHETCMSDSRPMRSSRSNGNWSQRPVYDFSQNICQPQAGKYERFYQVFGHVTDKPGVYEKE